MQVLTLFLAFWNRVDYRIRQMSPWLHNGNFEENLNHSSGLFKDYMSPTAPEILWRSIKNRDFAVTASGMVANLITLLIVVSTGLLTLSIQQIGHADTTYRLTSRFLDTDADNSLWTLGLNTLPMDTLDAIDTMGLAYPPGTTSDMNYQTFAAMDSLSAGNLQNAVVDAVIYNANCEQAELNIFNWTYSWAECWSEALEEDPPDESIVVSVSANNCSVAPWLQYVYADDGVIGNFAFFDIEYCDVNGTADTFDTRLTFGIGQARQLGTAGPRPNETICSNSTRPEAKVEVIKSRQWLCKPDASIVFANVSFNSTELQSGEPPDVRIEQNAATRGLSQNDRLMGLIPNQEISTTFSTPEIPELLKALNVSNQWQWNSLLRILRPAQDKLTVQDLLDEDVFSDLTQAYYKRLMVQQVRLGLTHSGLENATTQGSMIKNESRLVVQLIPARIMQACLIIVILLISYVLICFPNTEAVSYDPARLAGLILVLKDHPEILSLFRWTGYHNEDVLQQEILARATALKPASEDASERSNHRVVSENARYPPTPGVVYSGSASEDRPRSSIVQWWRPPPIKKLSRLSVSIFTAAVVIALQVLLSISNRMEGLADVQTKGSQHLAWSLPSAGVMVLIALYFRALGSIYKMFSPYQRLRQFADPNVLFSNYSTSTEVEVLFRSSMDRQPGIALMAIATILSAFLTIVVSGVWAPALVPASAAMVLERTSWFSDEASLDNGTAGNNAFISGVILGVNVSFPDWTYKDLALASVKLDSEQTASTQSQQQYLQVQLPAIRASLNCTLYDQSQIPELAFYPYSDGYGSHGDPSPKGFQFKMPGPSHCAGNFSRSIQAGTGSTLPGWNAFIENNLDDCPTLNYFWGRQDEPVESTGSPYNVTYAKALSCYETIEQVEVATTLFLPDLKINTTDPPKVLDDATRRLFSSANITLPYENLPPLFNNETNSKGFWGTVSYQYGIRESDYGDPQQIDSIVAAVRSAHGIIRAQQYHAALRQAPNSADEIPSSITAQSVNPTRYRLIQNSISTHILCALLLTMIFCAAIASWLMSTKHLLPKNPCSIAAQISLLADSNIFADEKILHQLEAASRGGKRHFTGLKGSKFRIGWSADRKSGQRLFTINVLDTGDSANEEDAIPLTRVSASHDVETQSS